jgi:hypothetical protein
MEKEARPKVLLYQGLGFFTIILLSWLDKWLGLSDLVFGDYFNIPAFHQSELLTLLTLAVWLLVANSTRRVLERVRYLEGFLRVCAWCRRIKYKESWMPLEEFMQQGFDTPTSHGICKECLERTRADLERARQKLNTAPSPEENPRG